MQTYTNSLDNIAVVDDVLYIKAQRQEVGYFPKKGVGYFRQQILPLTEHGGGRRAVIKAQRREVGHFRKQSLPLTEQQWWWMMCWILKAQRREVGHFPKKTWLTRLQDLHQRPAQHQGLASRGSTSMHQLPALMSLRIIALLSHACRTAPTPAAG